MPEPVISTTTRYSGSKYTWEDTKEFDKAYKAQKKREDK